MPKVGKKNFDYTAKGKKDAKAYAAKRGKKVATTKRKSSMPKRKAGMKKGY